MQIFRSKHHESVCDFPTPIMSQINLWGIALDHLCVYLTFSWFFFDFFLFNSLIWDRHCFPLERGGIFLIYLPCVLSLIKALRMGFTGYECEHSRANARTTWYEWLITQSAFLQSYHILEFKYLQDKEGVLSGPQSDAPWLHHGLK